MSIAVCLLNYNSSKDTIECLESLLVQEGTDFSVIIVDNNSSDNSVGEIEDYLKYKTSFSSIIWNQNTELKKAAKNKVYLIKSPENRGFSAGNNIAIKFSRKFLQSEKILLLNNDTVLPADFLSKMTFAYDHLQVVYKSKIALGATECNYGNKKRTHSGFQYLNLFTGLVFNFPIFPFYKYICGACIMIDKDAPLLDESYFLYFDDAEYALRLRKNNYKLCRTDSTYYLHKISATTSKISNITKFYFRSMWHFYRRNFPIFIPFLLFIRYLINLMSTPHKNRIMLKEFSTK